MATDTKTRPLAEMSKNPETLRRLAAAVVSASVWNILRSDGRRVGVRPDGIDVDLRGRDEDEQCRRYSGAFYTGLSGVVDAVRNLPLHEAETKATDLAAELGLARKYPENSLARIPVNEVPMPVDGIGRKRFVTLRTILKANAGYIDRVEAFLRTTPWADWNLNRVDAPWKSREEVTVVDFDGTLLWRRA